MALPAYAPWESETTGPRAEATEAKATGARVAKARPSRASIFMMGGESVEMGQSGLSVFCRSRASQDRTVCKAGNGLAWWRRICT